MRVKVNGVEHEVEFRESKVMVDGNLLGLQYIGEGNEIQLGDRTYRLDFVHDEGDKLLLIVNGVVYVVSRGYNSSSSGSGKQVRAPMSGQLVEISVGAGAKVKEGELLFILEAMKMENQIKSPASGVIKSIHAIKGQQVKLGDPILSFE